MVERTQEETTENKGNKGNKMIERKNDDFTGGFFVLKSHFQRKTKGQQRFGTFSHFSALFRTFSRILPPGLFLKLRPFLQIIKTILHVSCCMFVHHIFCRHSIALFAKNCAIGEGLPRKVFSRIWLHRKCLP